MRFGISTHLYHQRALERAHLLELARYGFRHVELFATLGHFDYHDAAAIERLAEWLSEAGLELHSVHAPIVEHVVNGQWGPPLSTAAAVEQARVRAVQEAVAATQIARRIPYSFLVMHLGLPDRQAGGGGNSVDAALKSVEEVGRAAAEVGVRLAVELIPNGISGADRLVEFLEDDLDTPPPGIGICLDMGHAFLMGDLIDAIEATSGHLVTTHVHDNLGREDDHLAPFDGRIDWPTALMSLQKVGYDGAIVFELADTGSPEAVLQKTVQVRQRFEDIVGD